MKRIPRIKFPQRHSRSSSSAISSGSGPAPGSVSAGKKNVTASSDVPAAPKNTAEGGKASLQPRRTPVSDKEIESIMPDILKTRTGNCGTVSLSEGDTVYINEVHKNTPN